MIWDPSGLTLQGVTIGDDGAAIVMNDQKEVTVTVTGAGFEPGITLAFVRGAVVSQEVIPVNDVALDPTNAPRKLTGKIAPVLKNCGKYSLVAWNPAPGGGAGAGVASSVNDVAVREDALTVKQMATPPQ